MPKTVQMFEEGKRDENHGENGDPVAAVQSPGRRICRRPGKVVIKRLDDIRHESFDNDEVAKLGLSIVGQQS